MAQIMIQHAWKALQLVCIACWGLGLVLYRLLLQLPRHFAGAAASAQSVLSSVSDLLSVCPTM